MVDLLRLTPIKEGRQHMIELINDMIIYLKTGEKSKKLEDASLKNDKIIFNR
jgi:hypothetical protein